MLKDVCVCSLFVHLYYIYIYIYIYRVNLYSRIYILIYRSIDLSMYLCVCDSSMYLFICLSICDLCMYACMYITVHWVLCFVAFLWYQTSILWRSTSVLVSTRFLCCFEMLLVSGCLFSSTFFELESSSKGVANHTKLTSNWHDKTIVSPRR